MRLHQPIRAALAMVLGLLVVLTASRASAQANEKIRLPLRIHVMTGLNLVHTPTFLRTKSAGTAMMPDWFSRPIVGQVLGLGNVGEVLREVNLIWRQANIEFYVESVVRHTNRGSSADINYILNAGRDANGRSDPNRIPRVYNCFDRTKHNSKIQNVYFFPFIGNISQGYAGDPNNRRGGLTASNYVVVGTWSNKANRGGAPYRTAIRERTPVIPSLAAAIAKTPPQDANYFSKGSLGRTVAHELGHNLGLSHPRGTVGRLMGGRVKGYRLTAQEIATARRAAKDRKRRAGN